MTRNACCSGLVKDEEGWDPALRLAGRCVPFFAFVLITVLISAGVQAQCTGCAPPTPYSGWKPAVASRAQFQLQGVSSQCATGGFNPNVSGTAVNGVAVLPDVYNIDLYAGWGICSNYPVGSLNTDA